MYPLLTFYRDGERFQAQCNACPLQCSTLAAALRSALTNLPCHTIPAIQRVLEALDENDVHSHSGD